MIRRRFIAAGLACAAVPAAAAENWPQWRGPNLDGSAAASGLPLEWSAEKNVIWKVPMPAWSGSTPAVWGDRIFVATPEKSTAPAQPTPEPEAGGRRRGYRDPGGKKLLLLCLNVKDGAEIWRRDTGDGNYFKMKQNMSSPSPITDGKHVWIMTGVGVLSAFDFEGNLVWRRDIQKDYGEFGINHGYAATALLSGDRLIIPVLHGNNTDDPSYLLALDKATGKEIWRTERPTDAIQESPDSYSTPQLLEVGGRKLAVINGGDVVTAHDIEMGKEVWRVDGLNPGNNPNYRIIASCLVKDGFVYAPTRRKPMLAIAVGPDAGAAKTVWQTDLGPDVPTPVSDGKLVWIVGDQGVFAALDAKTGEQKYEPQRLATGTYSASPLLADGKIYAINEQGVTSVLAAGPEFKVLATNELDGSYTLSSPIVIGRMLLMRTGENLYLIGGLNC